MADIMADAVAAVSRPPPPSPADREAVLGAVRAHSPRVPQAVADAAGALVVTPAEVRAAATHSKPGTAPGPDGIPVDVWRKLGEPAFELLAAVFTAVGATGGTPPGFLDGVVASIYKAKNAADAANYRPLTMLGSDYRILAKVLATRWTPLLSAVVGPEQTAFLTGRRISDNICLTQMLPGLLAANAADGVGPTGAALALLDFRKAYDTIDRGFLIAVMEAVGVGDGVLAWTRTILTHTYASAEVNGFISAPRKYAAGVRQGCPAAPALFLFLGHALACFLRTCPAVGVEVVPGCRVTCPQYADDCMPLLRSCAPADVAALVETMAMFGRATGLVLNLGKCGILPLGSAGEGLLAGAEVAGLRVLDAGVSLGVPVSAGLPPPEGVTGVCRERLAAAYTKLARFPMSAFGRGHAAATYGVSRILFRAVHCGMTPEAERVLSRWTATLVDRSVGPDPPAELPRWASSVPAELWGAEAPLWANPLLQLELPAAQRSVQWREPTGDAAGHALFSPTDAARWLVDGLARVRDALPGMRTVTDLCVLWAWLAAVDMVFAGLRGLEAAVPTLWRMPLLNARKEPIWRLWVPGLTDGWNDVKDKYELAREEFKSVILEQLAKKKGEHTEWLAVVRTLLSEKDAEARELILDYEKIKKKVTRQIAENPSDTNLLNHPKIRLIKLKDELMDIELEAVEILGDLVQARFAADRGQMITIVSAYSPTEAASDEEAGDFYLRVAALADKANDKRDLLIVAGGSQRRAWDSSQLRRPAVRREFNLQLSDRFGLLEAVPPEGADAQAEYDAMAAAIREVATNHLAPRGSRRRRGWQFTLSQRTLRLMDARQRAHTAWLRSKSAAAKRERNRANRAADAAVQRDRERWIGQQVAEAQDMLRKKNLRQFARACDRLAGRSRSHQIPPAMRDVSGALHSGPDGVLKAMTESFDKLYGGETKLSDETLNQLENDVAAFELTRATEVDEAHGRPPDLAETEACEFDRNYSEIAEANKAHYNAFFTQVRDLQNMFFSVLSHSANTMYEKYAQEGSDIENLPEDARTLLGEKDTLVNALQASHDAHTVRIDTLEDRLATTEVRAANELTHSNAMWAARRNRDRISEIINFIERNMLELDELAGDDGDGEFA
ncbi:hypothetical protein FOA52_009850 [Chlamydomonas sp. UWO 241]|nr:hypothetical protein FOA52_009850 [Chlamydomonas sp. UWO 241]